MIPASSRSQVLGDQMDSTWEKTLREESDQYRSNSKKSPSFSSTLLDAIYRSIDDGESAAEELAIYKETTRKKQSRTSTTCQRGFEEKDRGAYRSEKWMEEKATEKVAFRRSSDYERFRRNPATFHSTSSSSESSYGGFSSSEAESIRGGRASASTAQRLKPLRTVPPPVRADAHRQNRGQLSVNTVAPESYAGSKARTDAFSYSDMKKAKKLPVSPGARLAGFLNSLFAAAGNVKKAKLSSSLNGEDLRPERKSKSTQASSSTCSSASSLSRSCLSKTASSRGKSANDVKRSVRFFPVSVMVDEECRPCGQKCLYEEERGVTAVRETAHSAPSFLAEELRLHIMEKNKRVEEAAKKLLNGYQRKTGFHMEEVDDDDDDAASDASSDLFELQNLTAIGIGRYREGLPVYETTHLDTNRAIASGLIL